MRKTKINKLTIHCPIWKTRSIGVARYRVNGDLEIKIDYKTKDGQLLYPNTYFITKEQIQKYPTQMVRGVLLYIVPIDKLEIR